MKNYLQITSYFTAIILLASSCSKDDGENPMQKTDCTVSSLSFLSNSVNGSNETFEDMSDVVITYDSENRITSVKENYSEEICIGTSCDTDEDEYETRFTYNANQISTITFFRNGVASDDTKAEVTYEGDQLKTYKLSELFNDIVVEIDEYRFLYDNGNVVKIEVWETESINDPLVLDEYTEFTYQGNNIVNSKEFDSDGSLEFETTATFDEKVNTFFGQVAISISELTFDETYELMFLFSENNPLSIEFNDLIDSRESEASVVYQYNEFDAPTSYSYTETGGLSGFVFAATITNDCN